MGNRKWAVTSSFFILVQKESIKISKYTSLKGLNITSVCFMCFQCCNTTFSWAAYDALAEEQLFFHNRRADFVYVTVGVIESSVELCSQI